jgi:sec-independent protein translocase protein TatA
VTGPDLLVGYGLFVGYFGISPTEMLLVMFVALLLYGGELPKVARSWGKSLAEFKKGMNGIQNEFNSVFQDEPRRIPYHDPVYSHNAGTIDGHLADEPRSAEAHSSEKGHEEAEVPTHASAIAHADAPVTSERESI